MEWLGTWGGRSFGYREGDNLWTYNGELRKANRLITKTSKKNRRRPGFSPYMDRVGFVNRVDTVGFVMLVGYEDFPRLEP